MDINFQNLFLDRWQNYFPGAELPIAFYYTDKVDKKTIGDSKNEFRCLIGNLNRVREGHPFIFSAKSPGCAGGKRYTGFSDTLRRDFNYFLSYGIPGTLEGERYKKSPELVEQFIKSRPFVRAPGKYLVFKRWDKLEDDEHPLAVVFLTKVQVLSGLFTLANYDRSDPYGVINPMGSGCSTIVSYPIEEAKSENPRCVLGMHDVSARPYVPEDTLTFTIPMKRFEVMVGNMDESFLITNTWQEAFSF
jgi:hypothetical protein